MFKESESGKSVTMIFFQTRVNKTYFDVQDFYAICVIFLSEDSTSGFVQGPSAGAH